MKKLFILCFVLFVFISSSNAQQKRSSSSSSGAKKISKNGAAAQPEAPIVATPTVANRSGKLASDMNVQEVAAQRRTAVSMNSKTMLPSDLPSIAPQRNRKVENKIVSTKDKLASAQ